VNDERFEELMVKVADGAANPAEREELMTWVVDKPELRVELEEHQALRAVTDGWMQRLEGDLLADHQRRDPVARTERGVGMALVVAGLAVLMVVGPVLALLDPEVPIGLKVGLGAALAGGLVLLVHVLRTRLGGPEDPYKKVIR
jgi:ferric-dicitrate binding protein FerR (iron transport regulator)